MEFLEWVMMFALNLRTISMCDIKFALLLCISDPYAFKSCRRSLETMACHLTHPIRAYSMPLTRMGMKWFVPCPFFQNSASSRSCGHGTASLDRSALPVLIYCAKTIKCATSMKPIQ
ncbi:unnamed protein product [Haemonchus placei]|uniref:Secreted protein n=1 Tax=Haemonchus placei TaxID=6290 RepID=A0A0N4W3L5_HAEPC|nr:unnamed protein product [Haemonchus placei]